MDDPLRQLQSYLEQTKAGKSAASATLLNQAQEGSVADKSKAGLWLGRGILRWTWTHNLAKPVAPGSSCLPSVTRTQRLAASGACLVLAALCFGLAALCVPILLLRAHKFALLWSLGSALALAGGVLLRGGLPCSPSRSALAYAASLGATLYAALGLRSEALTVAGACAQMAALLALLLGLLPWGSSAAVRLALGRLTPRAGLPELPI
ncbi:PREDICTED: vesicle transport protein SFT2C [Elephantulus edwardii]|uniref:vesicle transport protein SFT2C n=1 Tax=Elephantulus edwardii TaxID=28737 RepID=UPI0003F0B944|nr:PREDICTED: vesicle transport protein SFT2C [Elephantulus edwardii]